MLDLAVLRDDVADAAADRGWIGLLLLVLAGSLAVLGWYSGWPGLVWRLTWGFPLVLSLLTFANALGMARAARMIPAC